LRLLLNCADIIGKCGGGASEGGCECGDASEGWMGSNIATTVKHLSDIPIRQFKKMFITLANSDHFICKLGQNGGV
jgi:hypothetical protein